MSFMWYGLTFLVHFGVLNVIRKTVGFEYSVTIGFATAITLLVEVGYLQRKRRAGK